MKPNGQLRDIPVYQAGKTPEDISKEYGIKEVVKLASNENPFGTSKRVKERLKKEFDFLNTYPDANGINLRNKLANFYQIDNENIILGNGSDELIQLVSRVHLNQDTEVIMAIPTFPMYKINAKMENAIIKEIPLINGYHDLEKMAQNISNKTSVIWICNPNNPTGTIITTQQFEQFMESVPTDVLVVVDEAYYEYVMDAEYPETVRFINKYPNILVLRTFSKIYGLASLRVGYGISSKEIIEDLCKIKNPFNVNYLAMTRAEEALTDQDFIKYCKDQNYKSMKYFMEELKSISYDNFPSETNFLLVKHNKDDDFVFNQFIKAGIIIRAGNKIGLPGTIRVTIGPIEQMDRVLDVLKNIV